jgi:hypothetical protein
MKELFSKSVRSYYHEVIIYMHQPRANFAKYFLVMIQTRIIYELWNYYTSRMNVAAKRKRLRLMDLRSANSG